MIEKIKDEVKLLMSGDNTGHGFEHVERVYNTALSLCEAEDADKEIVALASLLHDVDDYKLFGQECADNLTNAKNIMNKCDVSSDIQEKVCDIIANTLEKLRIKLLE